MMRPTFSQAVAIAAIGFLLAPFVALVGASLDQGTDFHLQFPPENLSLHWYRHLSPRYLEPVLNSVIVASFVAVIAAVVGVVAALGLVRSGTKFSELLLSFFRIPLQIPMIISGAVFMQFYYYVSSATGYNLLTNLSGLVIAHSFVAIPYSVAATYSVLVRVGPSIEEAAQSLGASDWAIIWEVILPAARPGIVAGIFYSFIVSFGDVPIALYLVSGDLQTFPVKVFYDMQFDLNPEILAASVIVVLVSLAAVLAAQKVLGLDMILPKRRN